jgi:phosphopantetheinyl transferase
VNHVGTYWLVRRRTSLAREYQGDAHRWLHPRERTQIERFASAERRASWLWGRIVAKRLLLNIWDYPKLLPWEICIQSHDDAQQGIAPVAWIKEQRVPSQLSISHSGEWIAAAWSQDARVGIDIIENRAHAPLAWWQAPGEDLAPTTAWSVREAAFKCLPVGERFRPRMLDVTPIDAQQFAWNYRSATQSAQGTAQIAHTDDYLLTLARWNDRSQRSAAFISQATTAYHAEAL